MSNKKFIQHLVGSVKEMRDTPVTPGVVNLFYCFGKLDDEWVISGEQFEGCGIIVTYCRTTRLLGIKQLYTLSSTDYVYGAELEMIETNLSLKAGVYLPNLKSVGTDLQVGFGVSHRPPVVLESLQKVGGCISIDHADLCLPSLVDYDADKLTLTRNSNLITGAKLNH